MGIKKSKRVAFTFDDAALKTLEQLTTDPTPFHCHCCGHPLITGPSRQVVLRNPETGETRTVSLPSVKLAGGGL